MGLASKLAASGPPGTAPGGGMAGYPQQPAYGAPGGAQRPPGSYPHQFQPSTGAPQGLYQQPYGGGPPQHQSHAQHHYGAAQGAAGSPQEVAAYKQVLERAIDEKNLRCFYPPGSHAVDTIARHAPHKIHSLCQQWHLPLEIGRDLVRLGLYDIIIYIDDSGSMQFEEDGERIEDLKLILHRVAQAATMFDEDGISLRFMNTDLPSGLGDRISNESQINELIYNIKFAGLTPMGLQLRRKVIDGIVLRAARSNQMRKPALVIAITDGQPAGDDPGPTAVFDTVKYAVSEVHRAVGTYGAISFQFAQVGNDTRAREFLGKLDTDPTVGAMVDCTSNFENEQQEMLQQNPPVELTPTLWLVKLLLGAIDRTYDSKDEQRSYRPGGGTAPPQHIHGGVSAGGPPSGGTGYGYTQQYGGPPTQQNYGPPQGAYGQQPQQGQPPRPGQPAYSGSQPQYPPQQPGYPPQNQYPTQPGYPYQQLQPHQQQPLPPQHQPQGGYSQQGGYPQQSGFPQQGSFPPQGSYAHQGGYSQQASYSQQGSYPQQGGYSQQGAYPTQGGYPPSSGYAPQSGYPPQGSGYGAPPPPRY